MDEIKRVRQDFTALEWEIIRIAIDEVDLSRLDFVLSDLGMECTSDEVEKACEKAIEKWADTF